MPDNEKTYGTVITDAALALVAAAALKGEQVGLKYFAVGDGGGAYYKPTSDMTSLKNEKWRGQVNSVSINQNSSNMIDVVAVIPADVGGFTIREMSVETEDGVMFAVCNTPDTEKVIITTGAAGEVELTMHIECANSANVTVAIDPTIVLARVKDIQNHNEDPNAHEIIASRINTVEANITDIRSRFNIKRDITIPVSGWTANESGVYNDVTQDGVTADMTPIVSLPPSQAATVKACGMLTMCETMAGCIRFYAKTAPTSAITASVILLQTTSGITDSGTSGGGDYVLPVATANSLGGVKIGDLS